MIRRNRFGVSGKAGSRRQRHRQGKADRRRLLFETLENRLLLAASVFQGLFAVRPNDGDLVRHDGSTVLDVAPRELRFLFKGGANLDPSTLDGIRITRAGSDREFDYASAASDFGTAGGAIVEFSARQLGTDQNGIRVEFQKAPLGTDQPPTVDVLGRRIRVTLNTTAGSLTTAGQLVAAVQTEPRAASLIDAQVRAGGDDSVAITGIDTATFGPLVLNGAGAAEVESPFNALDPNFLVRLHAVAAGAAGEGIAVRVTSANLGPQGPLVSVQNNVVQITLNNNGASQTTGQQLINAINNSPSVSAVVRASLVAGSPTENLGGQTFDNFRLELTGADIVVNPGYRDLIDASEGNGVVFRFAETLPDDFYRIEVFAYDNSTHGVTALRSLNDSDGDGSGDVFLPRDATADREVIDFRLDLGPLIVSVVPQPVSRDQVTGVLTQARDTIVVYFNNDPLDRNSAENPAFYRLVATQGTLTPDDDQILLPESVCFDAVANTATLKFTTDIPDGYFRLDVGTSNEENDTLSTALTVGSLFSTTNFSTIGFLGDGRGATDVDLYRVHMPGTGNLTLTVTPHVSTLDSAVALLDSAGAVVTPSSSTAEGPGAVDTATYDALPGGEYFVRVSTVSGTGSYRLVSSVGAVPVSTDDDNSSLATATPLGFLGQAGQQVTASIQPRPIWLPELPGGSDEPGHRRIQAESHTADTITGMGPSQPTDIPVYHYNFQQTLEPGFTDTLGNKFRNLITDEDKHFVRELLELYSAQLGIQFVETLNSAGTLPSLTIAVADVRAAVPSATSGPGGISGIWVPPGGGFLPPLNILLMDAEEGWPSRELGSAFSNVLLREFNRFLGLDRATDIPSLQGPNFTQEPVYPGDHDLTHLRRLHRPDSIDVDLYQFEIVESGVFSAETIAERQSPSSLLDSVLSLFDADGNLIARNDEYFSKDAYLELRLEPGVYYVGVSAVGNTDFNPHVSDSGFGGKSDGDYTLQLHFIADPRSALVDVDGTPLDGNANGRPGGLFQFWFQSGNTIFVDKANDKLAGVPEGDGSLEDPFDNIPSGLAAANLGDIVRIVGNGGTDNDLRTLHDNRPYLVGYSNDNQPLIDGAEFSVPAEVTVMIDEGALFKLRRANVEVGTSRIDTPRAEGALQVLGTPGNPVQFQSFRNDAVGGDSDGPSGGPAPGDWGGIVFHNDSDREDRGIFMNWVSHANIRHGGGKLLVGDEVFTPIHIETARPAILYSTIRNSADAAMSANPNSFDDQIVGNTDPTLQRVGPKIRGNRVVNNSINGLFVRIDTELGQSLDTLSVTARFDDDDIVHVITENLQIVGNPGGPETITNPGFRTARMSGRLIVDPGVVVKLKNARIEAERGGSNLIAEGTPGYPVIFTSAADDRYGAGGTFNTNNDSRSPSPGDWGGFMFNHVSRGSIDHAVIAYGGGEVAIEGGFANFAPIEVHQARLRLANSTLENHADGADSTSRNGRLNNVGSTIFVRGAQPIIVNNIIQNNAGPAININLNALLAVQQVDYGRATGAIGRFRQFDDNYGPLIRLNRLDNNGLNGMEIRGDTELTVESIWDDTDIVHVVRDEVIVYNHHTYSGLRLQSSVRESLVVKLQGPNAGFTASGRPLDIDDRIGGRVHVLGRPGFPVVLTSLADDSVGAGFTPDGRPQTNTAGTSGAQPGAGAWRGILLDQYSHDRNVAALYEAEGAYTAGVDMNPTPATAQFLGTLAPDEKSGDEIRRLGFEVLGHIAFDDPGDVDVYSFNAKAGTEIWIDIDRTSASLNTVVELITFGELVQASSVDSLGDSTVSPLSNATNGLRGPLVSNPELGDDFYSTNRRDAGMRVVLPGSVGEDGTYFVRVQSDGLTSGKYQLQIRLRQVNEEPGSTVRYADIRNAVTAIDVHGLPARSHLLGESTETTANNNSFDNAQDLGNLLVSDRTTISFAGSLATATDVDWTHFTAQHVGIGGTNTWSVVFDVDYADGLARPDSTLAVYDNQGGLILIGRDSNVLDDQPNPHAGQVLNLADLSRGTVGKQDPFIGPVHLPVGASANYHMALMSNRQLPAPVAGHLTGAAMTARLEPVNSIQRIVEDHIGFSGYTTTSGQRIDPVESDGIFDLNSLGVHVRPYTLSDVRLYVSTPASVTTVNPFTGGQQASVGNTGNLQDIVIRSDGRLLGFVDDSLTEIDPGNAALFNPQGNTTSNVDALTYQRMGTDDPNYTLHYAVRDLDVQPPTPFGGTGYSKLFVGDPADDKGYIGGWAMASPVTLVINGVTIEMTPLLIGSAGNLDFSITQNASEAEPALTVQRSGSNISATLNYLEPEDDDDDGDDDNGDDDNGDDDNGDDPPPPPQRVITASQLVEALTNDPEISQVATFSIVGGAGDTDIANQGSPSMASEDGQDGDILGITTGLAFLNNDLYGVTDMGEFFRFNNPADDATVTLVGPQFSGVNFQGLALGPQNVSGGSYSDRLFAIDNLGNLRALNASGDAEITFDTTGNGNPDSTTLNVGVNNPTGLAFSPLDVNLWHPTMHRGDEAGHGINPAFDNSRNPGSAQRTVMGRQQTEAAGGASFYFGLEQWVADATSRYVTYGPNSQYGFLTERAHRDLASNPAIGDNYNLPGGAMGSLVSGTFSLQGYDQYDKPTLYFNYWLDTEGAGGLGESMRDSARVYISNNGTSWELLATNNSQLSTTNQTAELPLFLSHSATAASGGPTPIPMVRQQVQELFDAGEWRQARVDLSNYAGQANLRLRFDFSTAGAMNNAPGAGNHGNGLPGIAQNNANLTSPNRHRQNSHGGFHIDDIIVGFAERGEMVTAAPTQSTQAFDLQTSGRTSRPGPTTQPFLPAEQLTGAYQLEVRRAFEYANIRNNGDIAIVPSRVLDTNDRYALGHTINAVGFLADPSAHSVTVVGRELFTFTMSEIGVTSGMNAQAVASRIEQAINNQSNLGVLAIVTPTSSRVHLTGAHDVTTTGGQLSRTAYNRLGDSNHPREQGQLLIEANTITNSSEYGISIQAGLRDPNNNLPHPGTPINFPTQNTQRLAPGVVVRNNVVAQSQVAIRYAGDSGTDPNAAVPFGRIINNTIVNPTVAPSDDTIDFEFLPINPALIMPPNDDSSSTVQNFGFDFEFFGNTYTQFWINNNGNITFTGASGVYTATGFPQANPIIAPFWADVDTRLRPGGASAGSVHLTTGTNPNSGNPVVQIDWVDVGYFDTTSPANTGATNTFTLYIEDDPLGDIVVFGYGGMNWTTGGASGGTNGFGGTGAQIGFDSGDGTNFISLGRPRSQSELDAVLANAPFIFRIDPDTGIPGEGILPGTRGILVEDNASPTILNNIISGFEVGISIDASSQAAQTIIGSNLYQRNEQDSNVGVGSFAMQLSPSEPLFVDPSIGNFYLAQDSLAIDSSLQTLQDRAAFVTVKTQLGIPPSSIHAPRLDVYGQARVDDPDSDPLGAGPAVFTDRGAVERADFDGPYAALLFPLDNDTANLDRDPNATVVHLRDVLLPEFSILLADGPGQPLPPEGTGVDPRTVNADTVTITQDNRLLVEGVDYRLGYNTTNNHLLLTPLSEIWEPDRVYVIAFNNRDRFAITAPAGNEVIDGDSFSIRDTNNTLVVYEYDSGYTLLVPRTLTLRVPANGGAGLNNGDWFLLSDGVTDLVFEFDSDGSVADGAIPVPFSATDVADEVAGAILEAIDVATGALDGSFALGLSPRSLGDGLVHLGSREFHSVDPGNSPLVVLGLSGGVDDGQTFVLDDGVNSVTFEFTTAGLPSDPANALVRIPISMRETNAEIGAKVASAISGAGLGLDNARSLEGGVVHVGGTTAHQLDISSSSLGLSGAPGVSAGAVPVPFIPSFEFTSHNMATMILAAINGAASNVQASARGGASLFLDGAVEVNEIDSNFIGAIRDLAGNALRSNQPSGETQFTIILGDLGLDFGDAPASYGTLLVDNGARHILLGDNPLVLGNRVDAEVDGRPGPFADGDDGDQFIDFDTSGIELAAGSPWTVRVPSGAEITEGQTFEIDGVTFEFVMLETVTANVFVYFGDIQGLYDRDFITGNIVAAITRQVELGNLSEVTAMNLHGGVLYVEGASSFTPAAPMALLPRLPLTVVVPDGSDIDDGNTFIISDGHNPPVTFEFEDVTSLPGNGLTNPTHRPVLYQTSDGAAAVAAAVVQAILDAQAAGLLQGLVLVDHEDGNVEIGTSGGTQEDDEDGVQFVSVFSLMAPQTEIWVTSSGVGVLDAWVDFNQNGIFDAGEQILAGVPVLPGKNVFFVSTPPTALPGETYARFRVNPNGPLAPTGIAIGGEVEDYLLYIWENLPPHTAAPLSTTSVEDELLLIAGLDLIADADRPLIVGLPGNPPGAIVTAQGGTVELVDGDLHYLPLADFNHLWGLGPDTFLYTLTEEGANPRTATGTITIHVTEVNDPPVAGVHSTDGFEDTLTIISTATLIALSDPEPGANFDEVDLQTLTVFAVSATSDEGGTVQLIGDDIVYMPLPNFYGLDTFTYTIRDDGTTNGVADPLTDVGTVTITVAEENDPPIAEDDHVTGIEDQPLTIAFDFVLENDSAGPLEDDDQELTVFLADLAGERVLPDGSGVVTTQTSFGGTVTVDGDTFVYEPPQHFNDRDGIDYFIYEIEDDGTTVGQPAELSATGTVFITVKEVNNPPQPQDDLIDDGPVEGQAFTILASELTDNDAAGPANEDNQSLTIISVTALPLPTGSLPWPGGGGTVVLDLIGQTIVFTPEPHFNGEFQFIYEVQDDGVTYVIDGDGEIVATDDPKTATALGTLIVAAVNDPPSMIGNSFTSVEKQIGTFSIATMLENDRPGPPEALDEQAAQTIEFTGLVDADDQVGSSGPTAAGGTVDVVLVDGVPEFIHYTPPDEFFFGIDTFLYVVMDDGTPPESSTGTITITVTEVNDPPSAVDDTVAGVENVPLTISGSELTENDSPGPDNESFQALTVIGFDSLSDPVLSTETSQGGTVSLDLDTDEITYVPPEHFYGEDTFVYVVQDSGNSDGSDPQRATATVTIQVGEVNDPPQPEPDEVETDMNTSLTIHFSLLVANDSAGPLEDDDQDVFVSGPTTTITTAQGGQVVPDFDNGWFVYTPALDFFGTDTFTYEVTDDGTTLGEPDPKSATAIVTITVHLVPNQPPIPQDDELEGVEDTPLVFLASTLTANDLPGPPNESHQTLTVVEVIANSDTGNSVTLSNGQITYVPPANVFGTDTFLYVVRDNGVPEPAEATGTVTVSLAEVNDPPEPQPNTFDTDEDTSLTIPFETLLANDSPGPFEDDQDLTVTGPTATITTSRGGQIIPQFGNERFIYIPAPDFFGTDTFTYEVTDDGFTQGSFDPKSATGTVTIIVHPVNDPPRPVDDHFETPEESLLVLFDHDLIGNDAPGPANESDQTLTLTSVDAITALGAPISFSAGMLSIDYGSLVDVVGLDTFTYIVTDNGDPALSATGTVTITITEVNDPPIANDVDLTGVLNPNVAREDSVITFNANLLTANDFAGPPTALDELDTQTVTVVGVSPITAEGGTLQLSGNTIIYTPKPNFNGIDTFVYTIRDDGTTDGQPDPLEATATVTVSVSEVNDPPIGVDDVVLGTEDEPLIIFTSELLMNDIAGPAEEPATQSLTVTGVRGMDPAKGTVELIGGEILFTPAPDFNGTVTFIYDLTDDGTTAGQPDWKTDSATVTIQVAAVNDPPITSDNHRSMPEGSTQQFTDSTLYGNDMPGPPNESHQTLQITSVFGADPNELLVTRSDGTITVTAVGDFNGVSTFFYTVQDNGTPPLSATGTVFITVTEVNDPPVPVDDHFTTAEDTLLTLQAMTLLANDSPGPANESDQNLFLTAIAGSSAAGGQVTFNPGTGDITYLPPPDFVGVDRFTYVVTDDGTTDGVSDPQSATGTVVVTVTAVNDPPVFTPGSDVVVDEDAGSQTVFQWAQNIAPGPPTAVDEMDQQVSFVLTTNNDALFSAPPAIGPDGTLTFTTAQDANGIATVVVQAFDDGPSTPPHVNASAPQTFTITVRPINDPPIFTLGSDPVALEDAGPQVIPGFAFNILPGPVTAVDELDQVVTFLVTNDNNDLFAVQPSIDPTGQLTFTSAADAFGTAVVTVRAQDDGSNVFPNRNTSEPQTFTITIDGVNDPPIAGDDSVTGDQDTPLTIAISTLLANDSPGPGETEPIAIIEVSTSTPGATVTLDVANQQVIYIPPPGFLGDDTFTYVLSDGELTDVGTVTVSVRDPNEPPPVNDPPVAEDDLYVVVRGQSLVADDPFGSDGDPSTNGVLANDSDPDGDSLTVELVSDVSHGTLQLNSDGTFLYTHDGGPSTEDTFRYRAFDGQAFSDEATVTIRIRSEFQNVDRFDVNGDGDISPIDALLIINHLNQHGAGPLPEGYVPPPFVDVDGDGEVSPIDVALVINELNRLSGVGGEGEANPGNIPGSSGVEAAGGLLPGSAPSTRGEGFSVFFEPLLASRSAAEGGLFGIAAGGRDDGISVQRVRAEALPLHERVDRVFSQEGLEPELFDRTAGAVSDELARSRNWTAAEADNGKDFWADDDDMLT